MRTWLIAIVALVAITLADVSEARNPSDRPIAEREVSIILKGLAKTARAALDAASKLSKHMSTAATLVDLSAIGSIDWDTQKVNRLVPEPLSPIISSGSIRKIGLGGNASEEVWIGSQQQVRRLHRAAQHRQGEIDRLVETRDELVTLEKNYAQILSTLADHSARLLELAQDFSIEVVTLYGGKNFLLSALDFEFFVVGAARQREEATARAIRRYDKVIASAKADLADYRESLVVADLLVSGVHGNAAQLDSGMVSGESTLQLKRIKARMDEGTADAQRLAAELWEEAAKIREHNAPLDRLQGLLSVVSSAASLAGTIDAQGAAASPGQGGGDGDTYKVEYNTEIKVWQTTIIVAPSMPPATPDRSPEVDVPPAG